MYSIRSHIALPARGFTLAELVVTLAISSVALGAFALTVAHQERVHRELAGRVRGRAQLREGLAVLLADLRAIAPAAGDLAHGHARDSSVELRTTIGSAVVCELSGRTLIGALASFSTHPAAGDTAWTYVGGDTATWRPQAIADAAVLPADRIVACRLPARAANAVDGASAQLGWYALELLAVPSDITIGSPIRLTRPARYSLYRAPDSRWYLGRREWSTVSGRFETIQPVSGPYRPYAPTAHQTSGLELQYFDSAGAAIPSGSMTTERAAQVSIVLRAGAGDPIRERRDAALAMVALRSSP